MLQKTSQTRRSFSASNINSLCILANSRQADLIGAKIIQNLREISGDSVQYSGYGGQFMRQEGFEATIDFDIDLMLDKTFATYRKTKVINENIFFRWNPFNMVNMHYKRQTDDVYQMLIKNDVPKRIFQARPNVILNIDNEYMTFILMDEIKKFYKNGAVSMPQRHYLNRFVRDFRTWTEKYVDYMHYTVPLQNGQQFYKFPSDYIGQYGCYEAVRHIYKRNANLAHLVSEDGSELHVSKNFFSSDCEKGIEKIRSEWRTANDLTDDQTVIFYAPGNEKNEAEFTAENARRGIKEFLLKYSAPTSLSPKARPSENFVTVISTHQGSDGEAYIKEYVANSDWKGRIIWVNNVDNAHLDAMCAADFGIMYDGQMISSAAACHLPTMNLLKMRMHHQWYNELFNRWWNDMNIIADNNVYPELIGGEAWFGKIADTLAEWYVKPDTRYTMIRKFDGTIQEAMSYKPIDRSVVRTRDIILNDNRSYNVYMDPMKVASRKIWEDIQAYELKGKALHSHAAIKKTAVPY